MNQPKIVRLKSDMSKTMLNRKLDSHFPCQCLHLSWIIIMLHNCSRRITFIVVLGQSDSICCRIQSLPMNFLTCQYLLVRLRIFSLSLSLKLYSLIGCSVCFRVLLMLLNKIISFDKKKR